MTEQPDANRSQSETVVQGIKQMLLSGELGPHSRLPVEKALAEQLGVSRGSLREGVRALAAMGILETRQGAGTYVTSLDAHLLLAPVGFVVDLHSASGAQQVQRVRRILETEAAAEAALSMDDGGIRAAHAVLARYDDIPADGPADHHQAKMAIDIEFHRTIARASGNSVLEAFIEALASKTVQGRMWRAIHDTGASERSHREHQAILAAITRRDPQAARILMGAHLLGVEEFLAHEASGIADSQAEPLAAPVPSLAQELP